MKTNVKITALKTTQIVETPDKITFSGSLTVGELAKKLSKRGI